MYQPGYDRPLLAEVATNLLIQKPEKCPNIVEMLDWFDDDEYHIFILEYPEPCMTLYEYLSQRDHLSETQARDFMRQVVSGVQHCFSHDVFNPSLRESNVLINTETMQLKIIDFGSGQLASTFGTPGTEQYGELSFCSIVMTLTHIAPNPNFIVNSDVTCR